MQKPIFVLLKGIKHGNVFFTMNGDEKTITLDDKGQVAFEVLGYADTVEEAQIKLYGRAYPLPSERKKD